jgi:hypothetical protein
MAKESIKNNQEELIKIGNSFLNDTIKELNKQQRGSISLFSKAENINLIQEEKWKTYLEAILDKGNISKKNNKENITSIYYSQIYYSICNSYDYYKKLLNDFDRQSLKVGTIVVDIIMTQKELSEALYYKNIQEMIISNIKVNQSIIDVYNSLKKSIESALEVDNKGDKKEIEAEKELKAGYNELLKIDNTISQLKEDNKSLNMKIKKGMDIEELKEKDTSMFYIMNSKEDLKDIEELFKITFNSFYKTYSLSLIWETLYKIFDIKETINLSKPQDLSSYKNTRQKIMELEELCLETLNNFESTELENIFMKYISLQDIEKENNYKEAVKKVENKVKEILKQFKQKLESDTVLNYYEMPLIFYIMQECERTFKEEVRW